MLLIAGLTLTACVSQRPSVATLAARERAAPHIELAATDIGRLAAALERMAANMDSAAALLGVYPLLRRSSESLRYSARVLRASGADMHRVADTLRSQRGHALTPVEMRKIADAARQASVAAASTLVDMEDAAVAARRELRAANLPVAMAADLEQAVVDLERVIDEGAAAVEYARAAADDMERAAEAWEGIPAPIENSPAAVALLP